MRIQSSIDFIPHPLHVYTKCFSTLICCGWAYGCTLMLIHLWRWGWVLGKLGVCLSPSDVLRLRSWSRLQSPEYCIPHPYHMNVKRFSTLICCGWAYSCTLMLIHLCRWGWILGKFGAWLSLSNGVRSWLRPQSPVDCIPHPYHIYSKCFSTLICCVWAYGCSYGGGF